MDRKLEKISEISNKEDGDLKLAVSLLISMSTEILRHAVEEEARLASVIMQSSSKSRKTSEVVTSLRVLQEHRRIKEFLDDELPFLLDENSERQARRKIAEFTSLIIKHQLAEERNVFPLALGSAPSPQ